MAAKKGFARTPSDLRTVIRRIDAEQENGAFWDHSLSEARRHVALALEFVEEYELLNGEAEAV